jgi:hypothetical protein
VTEFFYPGSGETLKRGVHQVALGTAVAIAGYNLCALALRREKHLAFNVALAIAIAGIEWTNVQHHVEPKRG